jgi:fructose-1-phosphate kinase PfkB-like protein
MSMTDQSGRVTVVGSLNADLTVRVARFPQPGETLPGSELVVAPGGKSSNTAAAAAVLGSTVRLVGAVGSDDHGDFWSTGRGRRASTPTAYVGCPITPPARR